MEFKTEFSCGDTIYSIFRDRSRERLTCGFCDGEGIVLGKNGKEGGCPECNRRGFIYGKPLSDWKVTDPLTVGQVTVKFRGGYVTEDENDDGMISNYGSQTKFYEEEYMCRETGIGSGSTYSTGKYFGSVEDAQAECDRLKKEDE